MLLVVETRNLGTFLPSATKLRRLCFYTCVSVHGGGGCLPQCMLGPPEQTPPRGRHPPEQTPPWQQTPPTRTQQTATAADGTHPTGMHSCSSKMAMIKLSLEEESKVKVKYATTLNFCLSKLSRHKTFFSKISESLIFNAHQRSCGN